MSLDRYFVYGFPDIYRNKPTIYFKINNCVYLLNYSMSNSPYIVYKTDISLDEARSLCKELQVISDVLGEWFLNKMEQMKYFVYSYIGKSSKKMEFRYHFMNQIGLHSFDEILHKNLSYHEAVCIVLELEAIYKILSE